MTAPLPLTVDQFGAFYESVHGYPPFPWQTRLAHRVANGEAWPAWLALPTASGKTSAVDIAIFALALRADQPASARTAPRRIFFVVDRRVIVDQAGEHAWKLAEALQKAPTAGDGVLSVVASRLRWLANDASTDACPLEVFQLRGGTYRDDAWVRSPLQPAVIASTVDQVGSRLLFRGYGLRSGSLWPIHAGLVANDALVILDEAHCSNPFRQTLEAVSRYRQYADESLGLPFQFSVMSATPPAGAETVFALEDADRGHEVLGGRLRSSKPTRLMAGPKAKGAKGERQFAAALAREALALARDGRKAIGVIVNRVRIAKLVVESIQLDQWAAVDKQLAKGEIADFRPELVTLLTGRTRPIDADAIRDRLRPLQTGRRSEDSWPHIVVATQTLEVGADLDFDGLVTECASLDALRQRFGRLNRGARDIDARGVVVVRGEFDAAKDPDPDPIYGHALSRTWSWLKAVAGSAGEVDFGVDALANARRDQPADGLDLVLPDAPVMLPAHVDCWTQTSPQPWPDPDVALFLHGPVQDVADVQVCWRADLPVTLADDEEAAVDTVALCPPTSRECMPVPLRVFRQWLATLEEIDDVADTDAYGVEDEDDLPKASNEAPVTQPRWCVRWRGVEVGASASTVVRPNTSRTIAPGETLVIPAGLGGWDQFGHVAMAPDRGGDHGDETNAVQRRRAALRLTPEQIDAWPEGEARRLASTLIERQVALAASDAVEDADALDELLAAIENDDRHATWRRLVATTIRRSKPRARTVAPYPASRRDSNEGVPTFRGVMVSTRDRIPVAALRALHREPTIVFTDEDDAATTTVEVALRPHLDGVSGWASRFAAALGMSERHVADITLAARLHDVGKVDPRFQAMLRGGNRWLARAGEPLAKSGGAPRSAEERRRIRQECGYPEGGRHELLSVRMVEGAATLLVGRDRDLVLHLIAAHHGLCRPFAPTVVDPWEQRPDEGADRIVRLQLSTDPALHADVVTGLERLDSGIADRFWSLNRRYGWWGLAFFETILRLADWARSEEEQRLHEGRGDEEAA